MYRGLQNLGNTCYMNSFLQALYLTTDFRQNMLDVDINTILRALKGIDGGIKPNFTLILSLQKVFALMAFSVESFVNPIQLKLCLPFRNSFAQHDANEFGKILLDLLERSFKQLKIYEQLVRESFIGITEWTVQCSECLTIMTRQEELLDLSLSFPIQPKVSLPDLIQYNLKDEILQDDNKYFCEHCNKLVVAARKQKIKQLANNLIISLNRFRPNGKILTQVDIPNQLMLDQEYHLNAIVIHEGLSLDFGHYFTLGRFFMFNDQSVSYHGGIQTALSAMRPSQTPYILFYKRKFTTPPAKLNNQYVKNLVSQHNLSQMQQQQTQYNPQVRRRDSDDDNDSQGGVGNNQNFNPVIF